LRTKSVGKNTEVTDAHEPTGKQMQQQAPEELIGSDGHLSLLVCRVRISFHRKVTRRGGLRATKLDSIPSSFEFQALLPLAEVRHD
jgi:hypothetical protein